MLKSTKTWTREEEFELFSQLQFLEKDLYIHILSFHPTGTVLLKKFEEFISQEQELEDRDLIIEKNLKLLYGFYAKPLKKSVNKPLILFMNKITERFKQKRAPRIWVAWIKNEFLTQDYFAINDFTFSNTSPEFRAWSSTLLKKIDYINSLKGKFAADNIGLAGQIIKQHTYFVTSFPIADLFQEGTFGIMKAIDKFDHTRGIKFCTYATWWIRHAIQRALHDSDRMIRIPVHIHDKMHTLRRVRAILEDKFKREPTIEELMECSGFDEEEINLFNRPQFVLSLNNPRFGDGGDASDETYQDHIVDENIIDAGSSIDNTRISNYLTSAIAKLAPREQVVIKSRFGLDRKDKTLSSIGSDYSLSRERIRQIEAEALKKLKKILVSQDVSVAMI